MPRGQDATDQGKDYTPARTGSTYSCSLQPAGCFCDVTLHRLSPLVRTCGSGSYVCAFDGDFFLLVPWLLFHC